MRQVGGLHTHFKSRNENQIIRGFETQCRTILFRSVTITRGSYNYRMYS